jgi:uncharacterized membrane protein
MTAHRLWLRVVLAAALLVAWFGALLAVRARMAGHWLGMFIFVNLFLAGVPLAMALLLEQAQRARAAWWVWAPLALAWLVFLPNAPYVGTDLVHLQSRPPVPQWFDIAIIGSAAACGVWLGYLSVAIVQRVVTRAAGAAAGWAVACGGLLLSGLGIYLGRFLRWNSWDLLVRPHLIAAQIVLWVRDPRSGFPAVAVAGVYGSGLVLGYVALRLLAHGLLHEVEQHAA